MPAAKAHLRAALALAAVLGAAGARGADPVDNGVFRFLTQSLPVGSQNTEYVARLLTANADGTVAYAAAPQTPLPPGVVLDSRTGFLTGRPTSTFNGNVRFVATDGVGSIETVIDFKVNSAGGGGNGGSTFTGALLPEGRVGVAYSHSLGVENGVGPYVYGAAGLPPGLTLAGLTGTISGTPVAPGTYFVSLSVTDHGENENKVVTVQPLTVLPATSEFRFTSLVANNGEVGTPFHDVLTTSGAAGAVSYSASGLPAGLAVDPATGVVAGTPMVAGTYTLLATATDGTDTLWMNLSTIVVPSATSSFVWDFLGLPAAITGVNYARQPPVLVAAENAASITYSAAGLPSGITYDPLTGELAGTATDVGEYPVVFTATDAATATSIALPVDFLVLPPDGGDASSLCVNLWISKETLRTGDPGGDGWSGACLFNVDRRTGRAFDPALSPAFLGIGSRAISIPAGAMTGTGRSCAYATDRGVEPAERVRISLATQSAKWSTRSDTLTETLPALARHTFVVGRGFRMDAFLGEDGRLLPPRAFARPAFVVTGGKLVVAGGGEDRLSLSMLLADPMFAYEPGVSPLRIRLFDGALPLVARDFTALGTDRPVTDAATGLTLHSLASTADAATADRVARFRCATRTGRTTLALDSVTFPALPASEVHLGVELTIGARTYHSGVTLFASRTGRYSTKMP